MGEAADGLCASAKGLVRLRGGGMPAVRLCQMLLLLH
jgi:hypothetical protein